MAALSAAANRPHSVSNQVGFAGCATAPSNLRPVALAAEGSVAGRVELPAGGRVELATEVVAAGSNVNTLMLEK